MGVVKFCGFPPRMSPSDARSWVLMILRLPSISVTGFIIFLSIQTSVLSWGFSTVAAGMFGVDFLSGGPGRRFFPQVHTGDYECM